MAHEYQISDAELKQLQKIELEMLVELDRICRKYRIKYSLDGGTLLGAVRHKGFIPWDDDADVIMLRKEYMKFRKVCKKELDQTRFFLQDYQSDPQYRWGYAKLRRKNTKFVRPGQVGLKQQGVFLDILVADNVPDGYVSRRIHHFLCFMIRKVLYSEVGRRQASNVILKCIYRILSRIPRDSVFRIRNRLAAKTNRIRTELISHYTLEYPKRCRYGLPRKCFDEMVEMEFEGKMFYGFRAYHLYLTMYYGDYMTLPPKKEQIPKLTVTEFKLTEPNPRVSIVIPVYNGSNYLKEAIDSALSQTYSNIEVIVVNDGSKDGGETEKIALSYGKRIRYLKKENGGTASALNTGINNMTGDYFSWLSHDDVYYPDKVEMEMEEIRRSRNQTNIVQCEYDFYDEASKTYTPTDFYKYYSIEQLTNSVFTLLQLQIHACGALIHKSHFERVGMFKENLRCTQDIELWFRLLYGQKSLWVPKRLFMVRVHPEADSCRYQKILDQENAHLYYEFIKRMSNEELIAIYGTAETALCRVIGLIRSRNGFEEAEELERRFMECRNASGQNEDTSQFKEKLKELCGGKERDIVIFGAGQYGRRLLYELKKRQIKVACFVDNDLNKNGILIDGIPCKTVDMVVKQKENIFVIIAQMVCTEALRQVKALDFPYVTTRWEFDGTMIRYSP